MGSLNGFDPKADDYGHSLEIQRTLVRFVCKSAYQILASHFQLAFLRLSSWILGEKKESVSKNCYSKYCSFTIISKPPHILYPLTILMTLALLVASTASAELELFCSYNSGFSQLSIFMYYTPIGHRADERGLH